MPGRKVEGQWPLEIKGNHLRARQKRPVRLPGVVYRTHDVGGKGHSQRIAMYNPATKRWSTQSWIFPVADVKAQRPHTVKILKKLGVYAKAMRLVSHFHA